MGGHYWQRNSTMEVLLSNKPNITDLQMRELLKLAQVGFDYAKDEMDPSERNEIHRMLLEIERKLT